MKLYRIDLSDYEFSRINDSGEHVFAGKSDGAVLVLTPTKYHDSTFRASRRKTTIFDDNLPVLVNEGTKIGDAEGALGFKKEETLYVISRVDTGYDAAIYRLLIEGADTEMILDYILI